MVPHLSFVRGSPPRSDAAERGRYADEDPLTFLDQVGGSLEESAAGRGVSSYSRLASKHRAPPAISWCGFTGHRGARHLLGAIAAPHPIVIPDRALELDVQEVVEVLVPR